MFRLIWFASIHIRVFMRLPDADQHRARQGPHPSRPQVGIPAMLLAIPYLYTASLLTVIIRDGEPGWLNLIVLVAIWSALKLFWIGPVSLVLLARVRIHEHTERRTERNSREHVIAEPTVSA